MSRMCGADHVPVDRELHDVKRVREICRPRNRTLDTDRAGQFSRGTRHRSSMPPPSEIDNSRMHSAARHPHLLHQLASFVDPLLANDLTGLSRIWIWHS